MTRNLYLGTDLLKIALAPDQDSFRAAVTAGFDQVEATNFPARSKLIAKEIKRTKPDLIGLQEAALWRTGPSDGSATPNATDVEYDYVDLLLDALERQGMRYAAAVPLPTQGGIFNVKNAATPMPTPSSTASASASSTPTSRRISRSRGSPRRSSWSRPAVPSRASG